MNLQTRRFLAIVFSVLIVTSTLTPAVAALDTPQQSPDKNRETFLTTITDSLTEYATLPGTPKKGQNGNNGKGKENGNSSTGTTTQSSNTTNTTTSQSPGNGNDSKNQGPPQNGKKGPNRTTSKNTKGQPGQPKGKHGNKGGGPPANRGGGPPENPGKAKNGHGPPAWVGSSSSDEERGPPEWVSNKKTPGDVDNRSKLKNKSEALAGANINVTFADNASAADYRLAAIDALQDAEFDGPGRSAERHRTQALEALNDSIPYILDANRTTSAKLFELDKQASTPPMFAPNVTKLLVRSDQQLATTAISDAERVTAILQARNISFDETAVRENITEAKKAYQKAERFRDRSQDHVAITQYRVAWIHAQQALDQMDLAATPNVTITTYEDMPHEGNITYTVRGHVFDVRSHELDPLTLTLNGANRSVELYVNTTPGTVGTFEQNLTLERQVNRITVSAIDPNRRWAPDMGDESAVTTNDTLRLDADGLPEFYEANTSGTDPLDYDSNSTRTTQNESANGVIDGAEDHDGDGVSTYYEYLAELKPHDPDTDDDELLDGFEQRFRSVDPLRVDTDNDTVSDATEDIDNDTLSNLREQNLSTHPARPDSDFDELNDAEELVNGTNPLTPDTDSDGLPDADEYEVETDPTTADTDGDGVLDGNETFSTTTTNETVGAAVNVTGEGAIAGGITVRNETNERIQPETVENASASEVLHFESEQSFDQANLTIDYDESQVKDEEDLRVYTYNRTLQTYVKLPSSVDAENNTATGTTPHFSTFVVMSESRWEIQKQVDPEAQYAVNESFDDLDEWNCTGDCSSGGGVVIGGGSADAQSVDSTTTRATTPSDDSGTLTQKNNTSFRSLSEGIRAAKTGSGKFKPNMNLPGGGGGGCWEPYMNLPGGGGGGGDDGDDCDFETVEPTPTTTPETTTRKDPSRPPEGTTIPGRGGGEPIPPSKLTRSVELPADASEIIVRADVEGAAKETNATAQVLLITDSDKYTVFDVNGKDGERVTNSKSIERDLTHAAGETLTVRILALNQSSVEVEYFDVQVTRDSDDDGLSNSLETLGILTGDNNRVYTDPYDSDTDGDGISDESEVGDKRESGHGVGRTYYLLESDPTKVDTDDDGIDDYEEWYSTQTAEATKSPEDSKKLLNALYSGDDPGTYLDTDYADTDPLYADTDGDQLSDSREIELGTNPARTDTDGDSIADDRELEVGADPTLHDYKGPEIGIFAASYWTTAWPPETHYRVGYSADDPSGVTRVQIRKEGETRIDSHFEDAPTGVSANRYFKTGVVESSITALSGTEVSVKATDSHRNHRTMTALERSNFYGSLAKEIGPKASVSTAADLGMLSGFTVGAGGTAKTVKAILEDPLGFLSSLQQLVGLMSQLGLLEKILKTLPSQMVESLQEKQDRNNPYDKQTQERHYKAFQYNWYAGYGGYFLLSMVVGGQATKAAKQTKTFSKIVDKLDRNGKLTQANRYLDATKARTTGAAKKAGYKLGKRAAKGSYHLSKRSARSILRGARTTAGKVRVYRYMRKIDGNKMEGLSDLQEKRLRMVIARSGDDGVEGINELDKDTVDDLLGLRPKCSRSGPGLFATTGASCLDKQTIDQAVRSVLKATDKSEVSDAEIESAVSYVKKVDGKAQERAVELLAESGSDGVKTINHFKRTDSLDSRDLNTFARETDEIDGTSRTGSATVYRVENDKVDASVRYAEGDESYVKTALREADDEKVEEVFANYKIDSFDEIDKLSPGKRRNLMGDIAEEIIAPRIARQKGYEVIDPPFDFGPSSEGFDLIARDPKTGKLVISEVKYRSDWTSKTVKKNKDWLSKMETKGKWQMDDEWVRSNIRELRQGDLSPRQETFVDNLEQEFASKNVRKEMIAVQNRPQNGFTVDGSLRTIGIRHVDVVKLGEQ